MYGNAFDVNVFLQLTKRGPPLMKNFPLLPLFLSANVLHTSWSQRSQFAYFDYVLNIAHFLIELANFKAGKKNPAHLSEAQTQKFLIRGTRL